MLPIKSETGMINIPLKCTCKKALVSVEESHLSFGDVIFGEQQSVTLKIKNTGALSTKVYLKNNDGTQVPFFSMDELKNREEQ